MFVCEYLYAMEQEHKHHMRDAISFFEDQRNYARANKHAVCVYSYNQNAPSPFDKLDDSLLKTIFTWTNPTEDDMMNYRLVCKRWKCCAQSEDIWRMFATRINLQYHCPILVVHEDEKPYLTWALYLIKNIFRHITRCESHRASLKRLNDQVYPWVPPQILSILIKRLNDKLHVLRETRNEIKCYQRYRIQDSDYPDTGVRITKKHVRVYSAGTTTTVESNVPHAIKQPRKNPKTKQSTKI